MTTWTGSIKGVPLVVEYTVSGEDVVIHEVYVNNIEIMCLLDDDTYIRIRSMICRS